MEIFKQKWTWGAGVLLLFAVIWWQFRSGPARLIYRGHKFEYLEPVSASTNRSAHLLVWVGYSGRRPRWWGEKVDSQIENYHEWSFSNGVNVKGGGGFPATAEFNPEKDCYQYDLVKGLTAYRIENGQTIAVAAGLATRCSLKVTFRDPRSWVTQEIPITMDLNDGQEVFK